MSCQPSASTSSYQTGDRSHITIPVIHTSAQKMKYYHRIRRIKSKGAIVVLILAFLVHGAVFAIYSISTKGKYGPIVVKKGGVGSAGIITLILFWPFVGWLADVHFGRYKVMRAGLWLMWVGIMFVGVTLIFYHQYEESTIGKLLLNYAGILPGAILFSAGLTAFAVSALQFGLDQMPDASAEEISTFIHWFVWTMLSGEGMAYATNLLYYCTYTDISMYGQAVQSLIPATMISLALCCDFLFRGWLTIEPKSQNPLKTVSGVLKYAATHNHAERPSAFTYCEDERPSRIDFAKAKYGGPFTTEQVEDVKTCGRMLVVIVLTAVLVIPTNTFLISRDFIRDHFKQIQGLTACTITAVQSSYSEAVFATISIPIYEVLIYPLVRNRVPSMLQRIGIGVILTVVLNLMLLLIDVAGHTTNPSASCMFNNTQSIPLDIDYNWVGALSNFLVAIQLLLLLVAILEFTFAQAPYNMKGLLVGLVLSLLISTFPIGYGIFVAWDTMYKLIKHWEPSCGFWFFLSQVLYATVGLGIFCIVAKRYKKRQRDEMPYDRAVLEAVYGNDGINV